MTAVVRYKIPYIVQGSVPIIHLIALGNDVSLCCVLELSTILSIGVVTNFFSGNFLAQNSKNYMKFILIRLI